MVLCDPDETDRVGNNAWMESGVPLRAGGHLKRVSVSSFWVAACVPCCRLVGSASRFHMLMCSGRVFFHFHLWSVPDFDQWW